MQKIAKKFNFSHGVTKIHIEEEPRLVIQDYCQAKGHSPGQVELKINAHQGL